MGPILNPVGQSIASDSIKSRSCEEPADKAHFGSPFSRGPSVSQAQIEDKPCAHVGCNKEGPGLVNNDGDPAKEVGVADNTVNEIGRGPIDTGLRNQLKVQREAPNGPILCSDGVETSRRLKQGARSRGRGSRILMLGNSASKKRMILCKGRGRPMKTKGNSISSNSSFSRNFGGENCLLVNKNPAEMAQEVWEVGRLLDLEAVRLEGQIVKDLKGLEVRDRLAAKKPRGVMRKD